MIRNGFEYTRHGDDVRVAVDTYRTGCRAIRCVESELRRRGLILNDKKTRVLHKRTYQEELRRYDDLRRRAADRIRAAMAEELAEDEESLTTALEESDMEQLGWDLYHGSISIEEIIELLRPTIQPSDVKVAETGFREIYRRRPGRPEGLSRDIFREQLSGLLYTLIVGRSTVAVPHVRELLNLLPEKTDLLCEYLRAIRREVELKTTNIEKHICDDASGWALAWIIRAVGELEGSMTPATIRKLKSFVDNPKGRWLVAAEATKVLGAAGELEGGGLLRLWNTCPRVFQVDLVAGAFRMQEAAAWAESFVKGARADPVHRVAIRHLERLGEKGGGGEGHDGDRHVGVEERARVRRLKF